MKVVLQMLVIAVAGSGIGLAANALSPHPATLARPVHAAAEAGGGACAMSNGTSNAAGWGIRTRVCTAAPSVCG